MSPSMESSKRIEQRAAGWLTKRDSEDWAADDERALAQWLEESDAHEVAFIRLEAMWTEASRLKALGAGIPPRTVPPVKWHVGANDIFAAGSRPILQWRFFAIAASVMVAIAGVSAWYLRSEEPIYRTAVGGISSVPMSDGSKVMLNTDTEIRLVINEKERQVKLDRGEAFFDVAPDAVRPFVVSAGDKRIIAVGTKFSVRRADNDAVHVVVTEGRVRVESASNDGLAIADEVLIAAGDIARTEDDSVVVKENALPRAEEYLSWRTGFLVFRQTVLSDAVAEFNRYNERKIVIDDPAIATIPLSGRVRTTNLEAFIRLLQDGFPVHARSTPNGIILTSARGASPST